MYLGEAAALAATVEAFAEHERQWLKAEAMEKRRRERQHHEAEAMEKRRRVEDLEQQRKD